MVIEISDFAQQNYAFRSQIISDRQNTRQVDAKIETRYNKFYLVFEDDEIYLGMVDYDLAEKQSGRGGYIETNHRSPYLPVGAETSGYSKNSDNTYQGISWGYRIKRIA